MCEKNSLSAKLENLKYYSKSLCTSIYLITTLYLKYMLCWKKEEVRFK